MADSGLLKAYTAILINAIIPIVAGAHSSLPIPKQLKQRLKEIRKQNDSQNAESDQEEGDEDVAERLTASDAYLFPILGSIVLLSLYLAFKFLGKELINKVLGYYFVLVGTGGVARMVSAAARAVLPERTRKAFTKWTITLQKNKLEPSTLSFTNLDLTALSLASLLAVAQHMRPHWTLANLVALSLAFNAVSLLRLDSFWTGSALLAGLFLYDIWWVFGTNVMESVARDFDAPVKILWPKDGTAKATEFTLLGLGDIVLPGIFIALALRFDYANAVERYFASSPTSSPGSEAQVPLPSKGFQKPYFVTCIMAYIAGLVTTIFVMHNFKAAQPALLYLSPACIGSVVGLAAVRGELSRLWAYVDGDDDDEEDDKKKAKAEKKGKKADALENGAEKSSALEGLDGEVIGGRLLRSRSSKGDLKKNR
ncbi:hypothetical protein T439DRAFT_323805 [Meredithblackwellia eburnea MCA 4105]